jgi:hypothetical protein
MRRLIPNIPSFVFAMFVMTVVCTIVWNALIADRLYHCTDDGIPGYITPGSWAHGKIAYVREINPRDMMDKPDTILEGWSEGGLWGLWLGFFGVSVVVSTVVSRKCPLC